jgi:hypothetical protein
MAIMPKGDLKENFPLFVQPLFILLSLTSRIQVCAANHGLQQDDGLPIEECFVNNCSSKNGVLG